MIKRESVKCNAELFHEQNLNGFAEHPIILGVSIAEIETSWTLYYIMTMGEI
jgi:hypothetical protein